MEVVAAEPKDETKETKGRKSSISCTTLPETNSKTHLKIDGRKMNSSFWKAGLLLFGEGMFPDYLKSFYFPWV